jgi:hypothetical protein
MGNWTGSWTAKPKLIDATGESQHERDGARLHHHHLDRRYSRLTSEDSFVRA